MTYGLWNNLLQTADLRGNQPAIICDESVVSFSEFRDDADRYGRWLASLGVGQNDRVLIWTDFAPEIAAAIYGAWSIGAIPGLLHPEEKSRHVDHAINRVSPKLMLTIAPDTVPTFNAAVRVVDLRACPANPAAVPHPRVLPTDAASVVFTSGSTGMPKGVTQSHGNLIRGCRAVADYLGLTPEDRILSTIPWSFDYGYGQLLTTGIVGTAQVIPPILNPFSICETIATKRPTVLPGLPSLFTYFFRGLSPFRQTDISSIRIVTNTGGTIPGPILDEMFDEFRDAQIFLNYGMTETYRTAFLPPNLARTHPASVGGPIPGVDVVIVRDDGTLASPGEEGQIVHRGDYIFMGYWGDPDATAKVLRPDPLASPDQPGSPRVVYTGDYGRIESDGLLYFHGRRDHLLKPMGIRVSPGEIEELLHQSGLVAEVAVFGLDHDLLGHELWTAVVPRVPSDDIERELMTYASREMATHMIPRQFIVLETQLPTTRTGKTDYVALKREALASRSDAMASVAARQQLPKD